MKREGILIGKVADMDNLRLAYWKARRGKDSKSEVMAYSKHLDQYLSDLRCELLTGEINVGDYHYFTIFDPKERKICAASFRERVMHHALMNVCHANFEKYQIYHSYASRLQKGTYAAIRQAAKYLAKYRWFLKLDVRKYFDSIDQSVLMTLLRRRFKDPFVLKAFGRIVSNYWVEKGKGLPIGNLTSQYFANHYLAYADHYLMEKLQALAYVRYMDDMVIWDNDKNKLLQTGIAFQKFIADELKLELKPFCLNSGEKGLPFCGYLLYPDMIRLTHNSRKRFVSKLNRYWRYCETEQWSQAEFQNHAIPLLAFVQHADTYGLRKKTVRIMTG